MLSLEEKKYLLKLARNSVKYYLQKKNNLKLEISELTSLKNSFPYLFESLGCFISFKTSAGDLRGCIGLIESERSLIENVLEYAVLASQEDPRFPPISLEELPMQKIEISVMGKVLPLPSLEEIVVGKHGLIVKQGNKQGLLLPQVPVEWGWNREKFIKQTCLKAGLSPLAYQESQTEIFYFSAEVFGEKELDRVI